MTLNERKRDADEAVAVFRAALVDSLDPALRLVGSDVLVDGVSIAEIFIAASDFRTLSVFIRPRDCLGWRAGRLDLPVTNDSVMTARRVAHDLRSHAFTSTWSGSL